MTRKVATKRSAAKKPAAKRPAKRKTAAKPKTARAPAPRKRAAKKRSGAASSAAIGRVSGSEFAARVPLAPSKDRKQRKGVTVYLEPSDKERLDRIAGQQSKTLQDLGLEAFALLFEKHAAAGA